METSNNTVLITGGSAGIGFEIAKLFVEKGNQVIITGRNEERLHEAATKLGKVTAIAADVTNDHDLEQLTDRIKRDFPSLNMVINNAGMAYVHELTDHNGATEKAKSEMNTNYFSIVNLNEKLLPILSKQSKAAIVNVSSIVAFVPVRTLPTYSATKAALHSYTQILRYSLSQNSNIEVYELMPPLVNTDFSKEIGGAEHGIPPAVVAQDLLKALEESRYEIHVAGTADMYKLFRAEPEQAFEVFNPQKVVA
jgi:uncharacterized oxidoreductase